jgi:hypothetical protein
MKKLLHPPMPNQAKKRFTSISHSVPVPNVEPHDVFLAFKRILHTFRRRASTSGA